MRQHNLTSLADIFPRLNVLVLGEAMLDSYLEGPARRICREAPVPIVDVERRVDTPGGAANTAVNAAALGCSVRLLSVVGEDIEGSAVIEALNREGVETEHVFTVPQRSTLAKQRVVADGQLLLRFDQGSTNALSRDYDELICERLRALAGSCDAIIVSDYGYGVVTPRIIDELASIQRQRRGVLVVDSRDLRRFRRVRASAVKPNYDEALQLVGDRRVEGPDARADQVARCAERILDITGAQSAAITLDADGAVLIEHGTPAYRTYARPAPNSRAAGAGDTFVSALAAAMAAGAPTTAAVEVASAAAAVVVGKDGTSACALSELRARITGDDKGVSDWEAFAREMEALREGGARIVFTNGVFDIIHRGHITYLNRAKALGDVLVVGVNSDASVKRLKGETRPINPLDDRMEVLQALSCVDHVIPFDEDTPADLIRRIRPHVYVKGGDYTRESLPESSLVEALGGVVSILPYLEERSTTNVIERVRSIFDEGAEGRRHGRRTLGPGTARPLH